MIPRVTQSCWGKIRQTTEIYTRADPSVKLEALEAVVVPDLRTGRFKATDALIASLNPRNFTQGRDTPR